MKRSTPLRRSSSLRTTSTLTRRTRIAPRSKTNSHNRRERDFPFMGWVRTLPCIVSVFPPFLFMAVAKVVGFKAQTPCSGPIEADHMGDRFKQGNGKRAHDRTCVGICRGHHRERHDHAGTFRPVTRDELRAWRAAAIERTQTAWSNR